MTTLPITGNMFRLLHHTLGVRPDLRKPWRNHFLAGKGHPDRPDLEALEKSGLMCRQVAPAFCAPGEEVFICTEAGKAYAIENLSPEPMHTMPTKKEAKANYKTAIKAIITQGQGEENGFCE